MTKVIRVIDEEVLIESAFKEGCEHGYKTAMKELEKHESNYDLNKQENLERFNRKMDELRRKYEQIQ